MLAAGSSSIRKQQILAVDAGSRSKQQRQVEDARISQTRQTKSIRCIALTCEN
jgi:hypothetical protein